MLRRSSRKVKNAVENDGEIPANLASTPMKIDVAGGTNTAVEEDESDMEDEGWDDDDDQDTDKNSEDEDSNYGSKRQSKTKTPVKKRAKTQSEAASPSKIIRRRKSLSLLPTMPLDVLFEIFSHLSPKDIVNLSRTSKIFHRSLSSRNSIAVWKAARERASVPDCPDWISEAAWADLLFGHICQSCGTKGIHKVDFLLLKRICISCKKKHYVLRSKVEKRYPDADFVILDLIPSTNISAWSSWARSSYYYWDRDLESMISKLAALKDDASAQQLNDFMGEQKRRCQYTRENSSSLLKWYERMQEDRSQETRDAEERRLHQVKEKFKKLGYIDDDLHGLSSQTECRGKAQLTDKIWSRIRPILEPGVQERKTRRLQMELATIKSNRRRIIATRYKEFQRTLHPSQWKYSPRALEIAAFEPFSRHVEAEVEVEVDRTMFDDAFLELPNLLAAAREQRKATLRGMMGASSREPGEIGLDPLDLATAVFKCPEGHSYSYPERYAFGWDDIASHHCLPETEGTDWSYSYFSPSRSDPKTRSVELKYSPGTVKVVRKLAQLTGLDAATATAADFDQKDLRFNCDSCSWFKQTGQYYQFGYTWRDLAVHLETEPHNPDLLITVLSDNAANEVKQSERNDRKWAANQWTCSHCPEYFDNLQSRQIVEGHLSDSHGIQTPSEPTDYLFLERYRRNWSSKPKFSIPEPKNLPKVQILNKDVSGKFRCLLCLSNTTRLFISKGVEDHLRAKHNISLGINGIHYATA